MRRWILGGGTLALALLGLHGLGVAPGIGEEEGGEPAEATAAMAYVPPPRGTPGRRVGGGTRSGVAAPVAALSALVPDGHVGLTAQAQPVVLWLLSADTDSRIDFTLTREGVAEPIVERTLPGPFRTGIQATRLADLGVTLEPGSAYSWFVAIVVNPEQRSKDVVAGGPIQRTSKAEGGSDAGSLARAGLWYDALAGADAPLRSAMLRQVALEEAAAAPMAP